MRSYHFMNRYPDKNYVDKFKRVVKNIGYVLCVLGLALAVYFALGGEQIYGGGLKKFRGKLGAIARCVKNSDALTWRPSTNPAFISHYLVFASKRPRRLRSAERLRGIKPFGKTKDTEILIPKKYRKKLYFYTVQAVSYGGLRSKPARPISCLQKGQGK